jgi:hypothetical protein
LYGIGVAVWEPETFRIELERKFEVVPDALMTKVLGAQMVATTTRWAEQYEAFFGFAYACDGIAVAGDEPLHPTPEQLAWAQLEINVLSLPKTEDEGTDFDEVDPAIAVVLHDAGFIVAPKELSYCQVVLDTLNYCSDELRRQINDTWLKLDKLPLLTAVKIIEKLEDGEISVSLKRLLDLKRYLHERSEIRATQNAIIKSL